MPFPRHEPVIFSDCTCHILRSHLPSRANAPAIQIGYSHWENWKYSIKMSEPCISENLFVHFPKTLCPISERPFWAARKLTFCYRIGAVAYTLLHASVTDTHRHPTDTGCRSLSTIFSVIYIGRPIPQLKREKHLFSHE